MNPLQHVIREHWGYDTFLPLQEEAMGCILSGRDSLLVLPTGGGKSLCFQAPALVRDGLAVVISPLLSLMKDQVETLVANGIAAARIDSTITSQQRMDVHRQIQEKTLKLLYVSPERMAQLRFVEYLQRANVSFIVIDEAHCISQWGHDFRPEYRELRRLREVFPNTSVHAFTATATHHVRDDIVQELCLRNAEVMVGSFDRPNLVYRVQRRDHRHAQVEGVVRDHAGESGIVYCIKRADVDAMCARLVQAGHKALPYHAGMDDGLRARNQEAFSNDRVDIMVATVAFGMGIDKSNVRYVIHAGMPKSIEHYQQETGRAGRDGLPSDCWLFYSYADYRLWKSIIEKGENEGAPVAAQKLDDMLRFCAAHACRHRSLVGYFGQEYPAASCGACDVCLGRADAVEDAPSIARHILQCAAELGSMAGPTYTSLILTGAREARVLAKGHDSLHSFGALAPNNVRIVRDWIEELVEQAYMIKTGDYNVLALTPKGRAALDAGDDAHLSKPRAARVRKTAAVQGAALGEYDVTLFEELRRLRRQKAEELCVPPYVVFSDATLRDMARKKPLDEQQFLDVSGVGTRKCEAFGDEFVAHIRRHCKQSR